MPLSPTTGPVFPREARFSPGKKPVEVPVYTTSLRRTHEAVRMSGQTGPIEPPENIDDGEVAATERVDASAPPEASAMAAVAAHDLSSTEAVATSSARGGTKTTRSGRASGKKAKGKAEEEEREVPRGAYHVALPAFEGPLDLLLHLIQQHELDVRDIPILFVSEKYVEYIMLMQELNIDLASEYLVMAATLAHIKSKMLLPKPPADQDDELGEELDPRSELVRRLLEYQKYKEAAKNLGEAAVLGRDVFLRGAAAPMVDGQAPLAPLGVFKLFDAFQRLLSRTKQKAEHLIDVDRISISERIIELSDMLRGRGRVPFLDVFGADTTRADLIVSFLAVLEMTRLRMMLVSQDDPREELFIELTLTDDHDQYLKVSAEMDDSIAALARGELGRDLGDSTTEPPAQQLSGEDEVSDETPLDEFEVS